jgi:hypothetical protein
LVKWKRRLPGKRVDVSIATVHGKSLRVALKETTIRPN